MSIVTISKEANSNYLGKIFKIEHLQKHSNADRLQITTVDFQEVITGMNAKEGDIYVYFPVECKINKDFLSFTNSFREKELNSDKEAKGFFEKNCRVRACKLRGENSMGYIVPATEVENFVGMDNETLKDYEGSYFDTINDIKLLEKYVIKVSEPTNKVNQGKSPKKKRLVDNQFAFHTDTENLRRNVSKVHPEDMISISYKVHGSNFVHGHVIIKSNLKRSEKVLKWIGDKIPFVKNYIPSIHETEYGHVTSSRRVIKTVEGEEFEGQHFYDEDIWTVVGEEIKDKIPKGYTVYGEIVGYTTTGQTIQKDYDYGCKEREHKLYVFRVTYTNPDGMVYNLPTKDAENFCNMVGLEFVPIFFIGKAKDSVSVPIDDEGNETDLRDWREHFIKVLEKKYNEKLCFICNNKVPEEGIVVRVENKFNSFDAYKLKSFRFLEKESKDLDSGVPSVEDEN